ncbi:hypothetical protein ABID12_000895 [Martelella mangrovi]|uniref:Uncharacterized protein n=1 Tax=Martelella mangrovi TaxID=1397477 RepID=A0ABV2I907_9HYPH
MKSLQRQSAVQAVTHSPANNAARKSVNGDSNRMLYP